MKNTKRTAGIIIILIAVIFIILFSGAWYFSSVILYPGPFICTKEHFVFCGNPSEQKLAFEEIEFSTVDGVTIRGWYIPAVNSNSAVILSHGRGANRNEGMRFARPLRDAGFNVITFDYRNCGKSDRSFNSMGYHEKKDLYACVDYLVKCKGIKSVGILGFSLGAATGIIAMAEDSRIKAGVFEAGFANLSDVIAEEGKRTYGLPRYPLIPLVMRIFEIRAGADTDRMNAEEVIASISPRPVYIIHGDADKGVDYSHGTRLFRGAKEPKQMWTVKGGPHVECWQMDRNRAESSIKSFFKKYL